MLSTVVIPKRVAECIASEPIDVSSPLNNVMTQFRFIEIEMHFTSMKSQG